LCGSETETEALGYALGELAQEGDVFCLSGDLGAGKTVLSRGVSKALGVDGSDVTSPTFALLNIYKGKSVEVRHFDLYRLDSEEELEDIGFYEYAGGDGVTLIEWAELFPNALPEKYLRVTLRLTDEGREVEFIARGERYEKLLRSLALSLNALTEKDATARTIYKMTEEGGIC